MIPIPLPPPPTRKCRSLCPRIVNRAAASCCGGGSPPSFRHMALARVLCEDLVGRQAEISLLEDALLGALRGDGGVVIVGGEAGMGKTRLVTELVDRAPRRGAVVAVGA